MKIDALSSHSWAGTHEAITQRKDKSPLILHLVPVQFKANRCSATGSFALLSCIHSCGARTHRLTQTKAQRCRIFTGHLQGVEHRFAHIMTLLYPACFDDLRTYLTQCNAFSSLGHGFKLGPMVGKLLCELSLGEMPSYDLSPFRIRRFQTKTKSAL